MSEQSLRFKLGKHNCQWNDEALHEVTQRERESTIELKLSVSTSMAADLGSKSTWNFDAKHRVV